MSQEPTSQSDDDAAPETSSRTSRALMVLLLLLAPAVGYAGWTMWRVDRAAALDHLASISQAQANYREGAGEPPGPNGEPMYAPNLQALADVALIDAVLSSGEKKGYAFGLPHPKAVSLIDEELGVGVKSGHVFELRRADGSKGSVMWSAIARPRVPTPWSYKALYTDQSGVICEVPLDAPLTVGAPPPGATPLKE